MWIGLIRIKFCIFGVLNSIAISLIYKEVWILRRIVEDQWIVRSDCRT